MSSSPFLKFGVLIRFYHINKIPNMSKIGLQTAQAVLCRILYRSQVQHAARIASVVHCCCILPPLLSCITKIPIHLSTNTSTHNSSKLNINKIPILYVRQPPTLHLFRNRNPRELDRFVINPVRGDEGGEEGLSGDQGSKLSK